MVELPRGTVTFLFTDIEGSTRLLKVLGERYADVLGEHRRILREAAEARGGHEVDTQGDSFFFAFERANAALGAAVVAQRALAAHDWVPGADVRVRMGLHTGEPALGDERYVGLGVHRAARIGAAGHGGQVLLSNATRELVEEEVDGVSVRELGSYRLKDIDRPERLFQLDIDGLPTDFPPLKAEKVAEPRAVRRRSLLIALVAAAVLAGVAIAVFQLAKGGGPTAIAAVDSVGFVNSNSGRLVADVRTGSAPGALAQGAGSIWVANTASDTVDRVDLGTRTVRQTFSVGDGPGGIAYGDGSIWVTNGLSGSVSRIDPVTNSVAVRGIPVGNNPAGIVFAAGSIWVGNAGDDTITRIDVSTSKPARVLPVSATGLAYGAGTLWATQRAANHVIRIDPATGDTVGSIAVGNGPTAVAFGAGAAWVTNSLDGTVSRINPATDVATAIPVGNGPTAIAVDRGGVWVSNRFDGTLVRIDPRTGALRRTAIGKQLQGLVALDGNVIVAIDESNSAHRGGTLTVRNPALFDSVDPAALGTTTAALLLHMTNDGLVALNEVSGIAGTEPVPDLAVSLPTPTDGGRTYTFHLRKNIRYSDGRAVEPLDVRSSLEREVRRAGAFATYYRGIVGAAACTPRKCDLSDGVKADDRNRTVTIRLVAPDPDFFYKLALPGAYVLPKGSKFVGSPLPATGPYVISRYRPQHEIRFVRNRYFHEWSRAAQPDGYPDRIIFQFAATPDGAVNDVLRGRADAYASIGGLPSARILAELRARYRSQVYSNGAQKIFALFLNTRVAPFDSLAARRAVNYALDRVSAVALAGGPLGALASCQILPPHFPGFRHYCPYRHNLARARALVAASGTRGMKVAYWSWGPESQFGPLVARTLRSIGYRPTVKLFSRTRYFGAVYDPKNKPQIGFLGWTSDYPAATGIFLPLFSCPAPSNPAPFCDSVVEREIKSALAAEATNPERARQTWERIDRDLVDQAPWAPLAVPKVVNVLSKRTGNFQFNPMWSMLLDQLWVR